LAQRRRVEVEIPSSLATSPGGLNSASVISFTSFLKLVQYGLARPHSHFSG
jgi:hypothetical protein